MLFLFKEMKESVKNEVVPHPPILMHGGGGEGTGGGGGGGGGGGHCSPPQSAAGTPCYWQSQADIGESVSILFLQVISMRKFGQRALNFS